MRPLLATLGPVTRGPAFGMGRRGSEGAECILVSTGASL